MWFRPRSRIERARDGSIRLELPPQERELLSSLTRRLRAELDGDSSDPSLWRLFPRAYDDADDEREYRELMGNDLLSARQGALDSMEQTIFAKRLDADQADAWLTALNDLRLVLGTRLDVREDMSVEDFSQSPEHALYVYLSWLQEQLIAALDEGG
jgi:hypothetical protein